MIKNTAGQTVGAQMLIAGTGAAFNGSATVYVAGDNAAAALGTVGSGAASNKGNGYYTYQPSQAETNYNIVAFTFIGSGASPSTTLIPLSTQTGDSFALIGTPANGTVSADIAATNANVLAQFTTVLTESYNTDGAQATAAQMLYGIFQILTEMNISGTTVTVKKLNGSTTAFTCTINDPTNPTSISRTS
jgi:hypothetical protein